MYKIIKMCIKSDLEKIILKLAIYGQREKAFLLSSKFWPNGLSARGYICVVKHEKNVYKIGLQSNFFFKPATNGQSDKGFLLTSKFFPNGLSAPARGYVHMVKHEKNVYKIGPKQFFLNLQQMGKVIRAFC